MKHSFLVEIGTEELPTKSLRSLAEEFSVNVTDQLNELKLVYNEVCWFATPRRLALLVLQLEDEQPDQIIEKRGPPVAQAFDALGNPTISALSWARSCGITLDQAERLILPNGEWLFFRFQQKREPLTVLLPRLVSRALNQLALLKSMRWGNGDVNFLRPIHTVTLLLDSDLIPATILGITSDRKIDGHRFMSASPLTIDFANQYESLLLEQGKVLANYYVRKQKIANDIKKLATQLGGVADISSDLLEEVTALVEWPVVLTAKFDRKFLEVPSEALVYTMKRDQKYFPVYDLSGALLPCFIFVANIDSTDPQRIVAGNERVIRSRLADAEFFFKADKQKSLIDRLSQLDTVLFQNKLGSLRDKTERIKVLSKWIAENIGADPEMAARSALLAKCDLVTDMVFEFPEIQGIMGMYYARHDGEPEEVAQAISEQYLPRFSGDSIPTSLVSCCVALADKIDTLVGIFGIGQFPKGDKDPFALRRLALGVLRILVEKNLSLNLITVIQTSFELYDNRLTDKEAINQVIKFILGRFQSWYRERGYSLSVIQAALENAPAVPVAIDARIRALEHFYTLPQAASLILADKRITNILTQSCEKLNDVVDPTLLIEADEVKLFSCVSSIKSKLFQKIASHSYQEALEHLAVLSEPIDNFFKQVMVMVEDPFIRVNRLTLLNQLKILISQVANFSILK